MPRTIVISFSTLDGLIEDPDGSQGTPNGGWAFRHGPEAVAGDKFKLGPAMETGVLLLGRKTWELFSRIWPGRSDDFAAAMNRVPKLVASHGSLDTGAWANSSVIRKDLATVVEEQKRERDVIIAGSASVVHTLAQRDLVDEYRILLFPSALGRGTRLFPDDITPVHLHLVSVEAAGPAVLLRYERPE
jgi:dihydrofolate reductase